MSNSHHKAAASPLNTNALNASPARPMLAAPPYPTFRWPIYFYLSLAGFGRQ